MSAQLGLFDAPPMARATDPATSHAAAAQAKELQGEPYQVAKAPPWSVDQIRALFRYDPNAGVLYWEARRGVKEKPAGSIDPKRHLVVQIGRINYRVGRVVWALHYGEWPPLHLVVDHKDRNPLNNRLDNLRLATVAQNSRNGGCRRLNKSGFKGVCWKNNRWHARLWVGDRSITVGKFSTPEEAHKAHIEAAQARFGEFAATGVLHAEWRRA